MARYVCKNMDEVNYIIKKFNLTFRNYTLTAIIKNIKMYGCITLSKIPNYCVLLCDNCENTNCIHRTPILIQTSNIMREEKLKRILYD